MNENSSIIANILSTSSVASEHQSAVNLPSSLPRSLPVVWMLAKREWIRFFRQPHRVVAAVGQPILFWILFGTGLHGAFRGDGEQGFMGYYLPGTVALILLFTAIFATISIIEDRREGFLQNVVVAAVPRWTIALGKTIGGAVIAWVQAAVFIGLLVAFGTIPFEWSLLSLGAFMALAALGMTALGVCMAWPLDSTQGFHALMNLCLMPMWLLSGAFFPIPIVNSDSPVGQSVMHWIMRSNPLTYPVAGMRWAMFPNMQTSTFWQPTVTMSWLVTLSFTLVTLLAATLIVRRNAKGDIQ